MRKNIVFIVIVMMTFISCKAQKVGSELLCGTFYKLEKKKHFSTSYKLELNSDRTFVFIIKVQDGQPKCNGKWEIIDNEFIVLKCNEITDVAETLTNAYMSKREHKLTIINKNKIKYNDIVLKRRK